MTNDSKREELIEEARTAIHRVFASEWAVIASALKMDQGQYDSLLTDLSRAAFAVFEKAHAPTERRYVGWAEVQGDPSNVSERPDGLHSLAEVKLNEQGEPTDAPTALDEKWFIEWEKHQASGDRYGGYHAGFAAALVYCRDALRAAGEVK